MGKIRISTLGSEDESAKKQKAQVRRLEKKKRLTHLAGMKGGAKIADMAAAVPELTSDRQGDTSEVARRDSSDGEGIGGQKIKKKAPKSRGRTYLKVKKLVDTDKLYPLFEAIDLVKKTSLAKFDASVDLHLNMTEKGIRGQVALPHGTGKQVRVAIANDALIEQLDSGKIDFDILVAPPSMMVKLVKFAKLLGPKGLLPNPKNNTISEKPEELVKKLSSGMTQFKTEAEAPLIHFTLGKLSFPAQNLAENFAALISAIGTVKIKSMTLCSSMSPGIKVKI